MLKSLWEKLFGQKFYLAPPGYDPTVDPLPEGLANRGGGGASGAGFWLQLGLLVAGLALVGWWSFYMATAKARAQNAPTPTPTLDNSVQPASLVEGQPTRRPTRTAVVWPTLGVVTATPNPGVAPSITPVVYPTLEGLPVLPTNTVPPFIPPTVARPSGGGGGGGALAPLPTYTPLPPLPTYTRPPATATVTASPTDTPTATDTPEPTATCIPTATAEPAGGDTAGGWALYLPLLAVDGEAVEVGGC